MTISIFDYVQYKTYLSEKISGNASEHKGYRSKLCEAVGCQQSYLSQVLNGKPDFTLEQAFRLNEFLGHHKQESKYFLLLVEHSRAGTRELKQYFKMQIDEIRKARFDLKKRLVDTGEVSTEDQHRYYSAWFYAAIHVAVSIPDYQDPEKLAQRFHLPLELVKDTIEFLERCGLIKLSNGRYVYSKDSIYLGKQSDFVRRHHINWRSQSLQSTEKNLEDDLHFSNVTAISKADFQRLKEVYVSAIEAGRKIIGPSPEEEVYAITLDVFKL